MEKPKDQKSDGVVRKWITIDDAMQRYPLSRTAFYILATRGLIESRLLNVCGGPYGGKRLVDLHSIERFIENSPVRSPLRIQRKKAKAGRAGAAAKHTKHGRAKR
jgi:hypothetical protein